VEAEAFVPVDSASTPPFNLARRTANQQAEVIHFPARPSARFFGGHPPANRRKTFLLTRKVTVRKSGETHRIPIYSPLAWSLR